MRYLLRTTADALGKGTRVLDSKRRVLYSVVSGVGTHRDRLVFKDPEGREVASIEQVPVAVGPLFEIHRVNEPDVTVVQKLFTFQRSKIIIDVPGMDDIEARGDFERPAYEFWRAGHKAGEVGSRPARTGVVVEVDLEAREDQRLLLVSVMVIALAIGYT